MNKDYLMYLENVKESIQNQINHMVEHLIENDTEFYALKEQRFLIDNVIHQYKKHHKEEVKWTPNN